MTDSIIVEGLRNAGEASRLAALHQQTLPNSVLARLGTPTLQRYYGWVAASASETLFVARHDTVVVGAAVVSREPATVMARFIRSSIVRFTAAVAAAALRSPAFRRALRAYAGERLRSADAALPGAAEVLQVFVAGSARDRRVGSALLEAVERRLSADHVSRYYVRTLADDNAATLRFYERRAFTPRGRIRFCGRSYVILEKATTHA